MRRIACRSGGLLVTASACLGTQCQFAATDGYSHVLQVVAATKQELAEAGVKVAALEQAARSSGHAATDSLKRSNTVLLVKNLPSDATEDALDELFSKHGLVVRVLLPRTKALAIVEMADEQASPPAHMASCSTVWRGDIFSPLHHPEHECICSVMFQHTRAS